MHDVRRRLAPALWAGAFVTLFAAPAQAQSLKADQLLAAPGATSTDWLRALPPVPAHELGPVLPSAAPAPGPGLEGAYPKIEPFQGEVQQPVKRGKELRVSQRERPSRMALIRLPEDDLEGQRERVQRALGAVAWHELFYGWHFFELPQTLAPTAVRGLLQDVHEDIVYVPDEPQDAAVVWNDPYLSTSAPWPLNQWYLYNVGQRTSITGSPYDYDIDADEAWEVTLAAHGRGQFYFSTVAVVDTQVDLGHADMPEFVGACSFSNTWNDTSCLPPETARTHGTAVAGLIGARAGNGWGMSGVNWAARLLALNVSLASDPERSFGGYQTLNAIDYATRNGAHIINYSGGRVGSFQNNDNDPLYAAIRRAGERDIQFIAAAGNENLNLDCGNASCQVSPAGMTLYNLWTVAAADDNFNRSHFFTEANGTVHASNFGAVSVDSAAFGSDAFPGGGSDLVSLLPGNQFAAFSGTSAATPLVSGVASLIKSLRPQATPYVYQSCFGYTSAPQLNGLMRFPGIINAKLAADCALSFGEQTPPPVFDVVSPAHTARLNSTPYLAWQAAPDAYVNYDVFLDGVFYARTSGTALSLMNVSDGTHRWYVRAVDVYGNWRNSTHEPSFVLDRVPPTAPVLTVPASYQYVADTRPALRWEHASDASGISSYQVVMDGVSTGNIGGAAGYNWPTVLSEGMHTWRAVACDTHLNCTSSSSRTFYVDSIAPTYPAQSSPAHAAPIGTAQPTFTWSASTDTNFVSYRISIDAGLSVSTGPSTSYTAATGLTDGLHAWTVQGCDPAGNCSTTGARTFTVDTQPPLPFAVLAPEEGTLTVARPTFSWQAPQDATGVTSQQLRVDGGAAILLGGGVTSYVPAANLSPGIHTVSITACDRFDRCRTTPTRSFEAVGTQPTAPVPLSPTGGVYVGTARPEFSWAPAQDDVGITAYVLEWSGGASVSLAGTVTRYTPTTDVAAGARSWRVTACDASAQCTSSGWASFVVDLEAPTAPFLMAPAPGEIMWENPLYIFEWIHSYDDQHYVQYTVVIDDRQYEVPDANSVLYLEEFLEFDEHTWFVRACDLAGNCTASPSQTFTIRPYIR
ncbi:S8 family serine peptidase [Myxococcus sp. K15C18031901]|uniref:S8 family serine peptidase n=1 Tax=Myxococcus dinghuensis TaxID=2906761 RepID=UPI0020A83244|nr:S8 family serine peptidase [Myxococcus dinghuensis]MCP3100186.1 S8 family serine peptidase [Myxococcus dinghuensis]